MVSSSAQQYCISLEINHQHILGALVAPGNDLMAVQALPLTDDWQQAALSEALIALCDDLLTHIDRERVIGVGVAVAAPVDTNSGAVLPTAPLNILAGIPIAALLTQAIDMPVIVETDVNAMALAEAQARCETRYGNIFYLHADQRLSAAIIHQNQLWRGLHATTEEISYLIADWMGPKPITLGQRASGAGIAAEYNMRSRKYRIPALAEIVQYARQGDQLAARVLRDGAHIAAMVLSPAIAMLDHDCVIVGGTLAYDSKIWWRAFQEAFAESPVNNPARIHLHRAQYAEDAALIGMATLLRDAPHSSAAI